MVRPLFAALALCVAMPTVALANDKEKESPKPIVLKPGDKAPKFKAVDDSGKSWKSADHVGKKILVVYFYPADMTGGCTRQACAYRDSLQEFKDKDVEVIGVSGDSVENHQVFKEQHKLNFTLLADPKGTVARKFGVKTAPGGEFSFTPPGAEKPVTLKRDVTAMRWTFVIDKAGRVVHKDENVDATKDTETVLRIVEKLSDEKSSDNDES